MKKDLIKGMKLARYGVGVKMNLAFMIIFIVCGIAWEIYYTAEGISDPVWLIYDMGAVLLFCAAMFPAQMMISVDLSALAQTSPYKKRIQTTMLTKMTLVGSLISLTLVILLKGIGCFVGHRSFSEEIDKLYLVSLLGFLFLLVSACMYKHFILTLLVLYFVLMILSGLSGFLMGISKNGLEIFSIHPVLSVVLSYALIFLGALGEQLLSKAFYKHELSRIAFGSAMKKSV